MNVFSVINFIIVMMPRLNFNIDSAVSIC